MDRVPGGPGAGGERARRWWLSKLLWKEEVQAALLPLVGSTVGGYHLEAKLGRGGQGTVYRARRGGRLYALKFLYLPDGPGASGQEVAPVSGEPEGAGGAAPRVAATPAPVARATPAQDTRMKTPHKPSTTQQAKYQEQHRPMAGGTAGTCVMLWAVGQLACTGPAAQVRPLTPADCPPEAQKAMREWGIHGGNRVTFPVIGSAQPITVRRGPGASVSLFKGWGKAPPDTVLTGELIFGEDRVYGRFTEARTPDGKWFPLCAQLVKEGEPGIELKDRPSKDTAVVFSTVSVRAVRE